MRCCARICGGICSGPDVRRCSLAYACCGQRPLIPVPTALSSASGGCLLLRTAGDKPPAAPVGLLVSPRSGCYLETLLHSHTVSWGAGAPAPAGAAAARRRAARKVPGGDLCAAGGPGTRHVAHVRETSWSQSLYPSWKLPVE